MNPATIVALASGAGRAGVAVIRLSGPLAGRTLGVLTGRMLPAPRRAERRVFSGFSGQVIDEGLALWFPAPASFTGEDVAELHVHGGAAVIEAIVAACLAVDGVRLAAPGEFSRRAFENGKLDLTQAEGLADLVEAETEGQRAQAVAQMQGALSGLYESWRARLIEAMALLEAEIDFPDENLPGGLAARVGPLIGSLTADLNAHLADAHRGKAVREGYRIAIIGPPNAGKSSLLNALARREAAIVSEVPGTTRDVVEVRLVLAGFPVWVADTAGLRTSGDFIEAEGVRRALARAEEADLRIGLIDGSSETSMDWSGLIRPGDWLVVNKWDLPGGSAARAAALWAVDMETGLYSLSLAGGPPISGVMAIEEFEVELTNHVSSRLAAREAPALTRLRHTRLVEEALAALMRAVPALDQGAELVAEDLRAGAAALGRLTGRIDVEDLLDEVFASFCIGK